MPICFGGDSSGHPLLEYAKLGPAWPLTLLFCTNAALHISRRPIV